MEVQSLVKLAAGGNLKVLEEEWMGRLEDDSASPDTLVQMLPVVDKLLERDYKSEATDLAWTSLELLGERFTDADMLDAAGALLLKLDHSAELREQVTAMYRRAHGTHTGLDRLLAEAGLAGGRPVRRALRTLEVCLAVAQGTYLAGRHDNATARVVSVDGQSWEVRVRNAGGQEKVYGPVELADTYAPTDAEDYRVLRDFDRGRLVERLNRDPAGVVVSILQTAGNRMTSDDLEQLLCPSLIEPADWSKWWSKARTALKRDPHVELQGRSPYLLKYLPSARTLEDETRQGVSKLADAAAQYAAVETYLRECSSRKRQPDAAFLKQWVADLDARARRQHKGGGTLVLGTRLVQRRIEQSIGSHNAEQVVLGLLRSLPEVGAAIQSLGSAPLWAEACACLEIAFPDRAAELLADLLPQAPMAACDGIAAQLVRLGFGAERFDELVNRILADPVRCHQGLFWLWNGPQVEQVCGYSSVTVLLRVLPVLAEVARSEKVPRPTRRDIESTARSVLAARKYERFHAALEGIEVGMASTVLTQIRRLTNLGRVVHEDLQRIVRRRFPELDAAPVIQPWEDETVLFTTETGLIGKRVERDDLINIKMAENARRIGEAASHGDLSENSEYKFALEERDLLRARLAQMQEQLGMAKVLRADDVATDRVNVGVRVKARHVDSGAAVELVFLGPWDADLERHVYNYKTPLARSMMGKTVGDVVELSTVDPPGRYEIMAIENSLVG